LASFLVPNLLRTPLLKLMPVLIFGYCQPTKCQQEEAELIGAIQQQMAADKSEWANIYG